MDPFIVKIQEYIRLHNLVSGGDAVLLSLSAGKDSMALFEAMLALRDTIGFSLAVFHLNHGTRGEESDGDESFLRERVSREGVAFHSRRHDFSTLPGGVSFEDQARRVRYAMLEETARDLGCTRIATAHTMTDNYETIIMRMFEGTGLLGMTGIRNMRGAIVRPMLCVSSREVVEFLRTSGIAWREDSTNADTAYLRNYVRHELCPRIESRFPRAEQSLTGLGVIAGECADMLDELMVKCYGRFYRRTAEGAVVDCGEFIGDRRIFAHVMARAMNDLGMFFSKSVLDEIYRKAGSDRRSMELYATPEIRIVMERTESGTVIRFQSGDAKPEESIGLWEYGIGLPEGGKTSLHIEETGVTLCIERCDIGFFEAHRNRHDMVFLDLKSPRHYIVIRNRRAGDRITSGGVTRKVKDIMIENKLDTAEKNSIPLIIVNSRVAALMLGLYRPVPSRVSGEFFVDDASTYIVSVYRKSP